MRAFRLRGWGEGTHFENVPVPTPKGDEVLVKVTATGLCQSDLHLIDSDTPRGRYPVPFTLGHEISGVVVELGPEATGITVGDPVLVYSPIGCQRCSRCAEGRDNYCDRPDESAPLAVGIGRDGGMAEYTIVPRSSHVVPLGELDPVSAAPLADAALTSYHAIAAYPELTQPHSSVLVIGVGGLGHVAVQILEAVTQAKVIAVDTKTAALDLALVKGAEVAVASGPMAQSEIAEATEGRGCDVILDFVGTDDTIALATRSLRMGGALAIVGSGGGTLPLAKGPSTPRGIRVSQPFWGSLSDLHAVVELAKTGALVIEAESTNLDEVEQAIARLRTGAVQGRLVLVP